MSSAALLFHVDIDAFFASVEQLLIPALRNKPVIVGSGCIASCSYEARRFGLYAGMSLRRAKRLCPQAVILKGQYSIYRCFAEHVWEICRRFTSALETYLDEAYGEIPGPCGLIDNPDQLGHELQRQVKDEVGLPVSVGLAANRMMAKIASSLAKPFGVLWIPPRQEANFLAPLPIEKIPGIGAKTAQRLGEMNIRIVSELARLDRSLLRAMFGRRGELLYDRCRGIDDQLLRPDALPKSISRETTFHVPTCDRHEIRGMLYYLLERAMRAMRQLRLQCKRIDTSIRYDDFTSQHAGRGLIEPTDDDEAAFHIVIDIFERLYQRRVALRHVGIVLSRFSAANNQLELLAPPGSQQRKRLQKAIDTVRDRYGHAAMVTGESIDLLGRLEQNDYGFVLRTPSLTK